MSVYDDLIDMSKIGTDTDTKIREERKARMEQRRIRKLQIRKRALILIAGGVILSGGITAAIHIHNKPINKVTRELTSDAGLNLTDDGRKISGEMTEEELLTYIQAHDLTEESIEASVERFLTHEGFDVDFGMKKVKNANPSVFSEYENVVGFNDIEGYKAMGR